MAKGELMAKGAKAGAAAQHASGRVVPLVELAVVGIPPIDNDGGGSLAPSIASRAIKTVDPAGNHAWTQDHEMPDSGVPLYGGAHPMADPSGRYVSGTSAVIPLPLPQGAAPITDPGDAHGGPFAIEGTR